MPPLPVLVAGIPVLHGRVLDLGVVQRDQLDHRGMQLVLVAHRRGAALEIADVGALVGDDQGALELPGVWRVDAEIGRQLHRAAHALGDVDEGAVGEHRRIERRVLVVRVGHDRAEILRTSSGWFWHRLGDRAEDDAHLLQLLLEGGGDRDAVEHGVDGDAGQHFLLAQRDAELLRRCACSSGSTSSRLLGRRPALRRRVVVGVLVVDRREVTFAQHGSGMVCQWRNAFSRHSSSHSGSFFLAEMKRTMSSLRPLGPCRTRCR
jgi:hypothetical protein